MSQDNRERNVTDMHTGGQKAETEVTLKDRAEAMADEVQRRYGKAKEQGADLAETVTEEVANQSHRLRERLEDFEPREAGRAVLRHARNDQWPLLLIGGALGFGIAAWMGAAASKPAPATRTRRRKS